jgi:hypothetical protein
MERAALQGVLSHSRTLEPFVQELVDDAKFGDPKKELQEMIDDANRELDETEAEMAAVVPDTDQGNQYLDPSGGDADGCSGGSNGVRSSEVWAEDGEM